MGTIKRTCIAGLLLSASTLTHAVMWTDVDLDGNEGQPHYVQLSEGPWGYPDTFSSEFDLTLDGFLPGTHEVLEAEVTFAFADGTTPDGDEIVTIVLDLESIPELTDIEVDGSHTAGFDFYSYSLPVTGTLMTSLNDDGKLAYSVTITEGTAFLKEARLDARGVPDSGSSLALLGLGLLTLFSARENLRKMKR